MLNKFILFFLLLLTPLFAGGIQEKDGQPSRPLIELLSLYAPEAQEGDWKAIIEATQARWLRAPALERWQCSPLKDLDTEKSFALFSELGMTEEMRAQKNYYDYVAIAGATVHRVRTRLAFLKSEWERGLRFGKLVFLTGDRPLDPEVESEEALGRAPCRPCNETEMMLLVFQEIEPPTEWKERLLIVDTPRPRGKSRPNLVDTYVEFARGKPRAGSLLLIGDEPFLPRFLAAAHPIFDPIGIEVEAAGYGVTFEEFRRHPLALAICLDELARWIYIEKQGPSYK